MITLSKKTKDAEVIIDDLIKLNDIGYYKVDNRYSKQKITLTTKDNDALIEFLTEINEQEGYESLNSQSYRNKELNYKTSILTINYTQKAIFIQLLSQF
jgi:hypothetical protein